MLEWLRNKIKSDFIKVYFFDMVGKVFSVIISIVIIRCLTTSDYAQYTLFNSIGSFLNGVVGTSITLAYTRYAVILREREPGLEGMLYRYVRNKMFIFAGAIGAVSFLVFRMISDVSIVYVLGICYGLMLALYQLNIVFFQAREQYSFGGVVSNIKNILVALVLSLIFISSVNVKLSPLLMVYLAVVALAWIVTLVLINKNLKKDGLVYSRETGKQFFLAMLQDSGWIMMYAFMLSAFNQLDVMLLTYMRPQADVAGYGVAYKYYANVLSLLPALQVVLRVRNSKIEMATNKELRRRSVLEWVRKSAPLALLLFVAGSIGSYLCFPILNGAKYNSSIFTFDILLIGACLSYVTAPNVSFMLSGGKQKTMFFLSIGSFLINAVGNYIFIPHYGANAAAVTTIMAHFFLNGGSTLILLLDKPDDKQGAQIS